MSTYHTFYWFMCKGGCMYTCILKRRRGLNASLMDHFVHTFLVVYKTTLTVWKVIPLL
jgi:hypothetical protein